jgi:hypothetical protein
VAFGLRYPVGFFLGERRMREFVVLFVFSIFFWFRIILWICGRRLRDLKLSVFYRFWLFCVPSRFQFLGSDIDLEIILETELLQPQALLPVILSLLSQLGVPFGSQQIMFLIKLPILSILPQFR